MALTKINSFIKKVKKSARNNPKSIVFPEGFDDRIILASQEILKEKLAYPILIGNPNEILKKAEKLKIKLNQKNTKIIDPENFKKINDYADKLYELRKDKGMTKDEAYNILKTKPPYLATMMVEMNDADGMIGGAYWSTAENILPALQIIKTKEKFHKVSGVFFMILEKRLLLFSDTSIIIDPNSHELSDIAIDTAETAKKFGIDPKIAMLSFSTAGSAKHPMVDKVKEATLLVKEKRPDLVCEGEMQVDAALIPAVCGKKFPGSKIKGDANVLIFPDVNSGNIAYKLVERLASAIAIGPIIQGLKKPVNIISRGCSVQDIVISSAFTTLDASANEHHS